MFKKIACFLLLFCMHHRTIFAQDIHIILANIKIKMNKIKDYEAEGQMKTKVVFLKLPVAAVKLYFKNPNKFKLKTSKVFHLFPKAQ